METEQVVEKLTSQGNKSVAVVKINMGKKNKK